jgi:hypothetical protein
MPVAGVRSIGGLAMRQSSRGEDHGSPAYFVEYGSKRVYIPAVKTRRLIKYLPAKLECIGQPEGQFDPLFRKYAGEIARSLLRKN